MAGANYMGGKRNTVKLKLKDATGRAQKGFFGRQRLEMLSKGLIPNHKASKNDIPGNSKRSEITLSHAKLNVECASDGATNCNQAFERPRIRVDNVQDCSSVSARDIPQPNAPLRSICDRILAISDLAGLHRYKMPCGNESSFTKLPGRTSLKEPLIDTDLAQGSCSTRLSPYSLSSFTTYSMLVSRRSIISNSSDHSLWSWNMGDIVDEHIQEAGSANMNDECSFRDEIEASPPCTPILRRRISRGMPLLYRTPSATSASWHEANRSTNSSPLLSYLGEDEGVHVQSYMLYDSNVETFDTRGFSTPKSGSCSNVFVGPQSLSVDTSPFTWTETPQASLYAEASYQESAGSGQSFSRNKELLTQLPGCIFDYEDPWDAIGMIMGLPRNDAREKTLEEEMATLGATGHGIVISDEAVQADTVVESYSDKTGSTLFSSDGLHIAQDSHCSRIPWHQTCECPKDPGFDEIGVTCMPRSGGPCSDVIDSDVDRFPDPSSRGSPSNQLTSSVNMEQKEPYAEDAPAYRHSPPLPSTEAVKYNDYLMERGIAEIEPNYDILSKTASLSSDRQADSRPEPNGSCYELCLFSDDSGDDSA
ncbi:hypothetical protein APHAL10511_007844 [Amanita phalloides]|nr:hypothetical protein APHAL10511_007844 [Amanita phalloides]